MEPDEPKNEQGEKLISVDDEIKRLEEKKLYKNYKIKRLEKEIEIIDIELDYLISNK